jgi:opacity protein-like surface antigen
MLKKRLFLICASLLCAFAALAQNQAAQGTDSVKNARIENPATGGNATQPIRLLEIGIGPTAYRGDLSNGYRKWASAVHVGLKFNRKRRLNGHLNVAFGTVTGQNAGYAFTGESETTPTPNRFFRTSFVSVNYDLQVNLLKTPRWIVYASQGVGFMRFNPKDEFGNPLQDQLNTRTAGESYGNIAVMLPTQAGALYLLPNGYGVGIQGGFANPLTDYLDNISQWGNRNGGDNMLWLKFQFVVPMGFVVPMKNEK